MNFLYHCGCKKVYSLLDGHGRATPESNHSCLAHQSRSSTHHHRVLKDFQILDMRASSSGYLTQHTDTTLCLYFYEYVDFFRHLDDFPLICIEIRRTLSVYKAKSLEVRSRLYNFFAIPREPLILRRKVGFSLSLVTFKQTHSLLDLQYCTQFNRQTLTELVKYVMFKQSVPKFFETFRFSAHQKAF